MFDDLEAKPQKPVTAALTQHDLERLSVHELDSLKQSRQLDIDLINAEISKKTAHAAAANALFKA